MTHLAIGAVLATGALVAVVSAPRVIGGMIDVCGGKPFRTDCRG